MLTIKLKGIDQEDFLKKLYDRIKETERNYKFVLDEDGDITYQNKEWEDDGYGYNSWSWDKFSNKAWMRPHFGDNGKMLFYIIGSRKEQKMSKAVYAFYHSKLSYFLLTEYDLYIDSVEITSNPNGEDKIQ